METTKANNLPQRQTQTTLSRLLSSADNDAPVAVKLAKYANTLSPALILQTEDRVLQLESDIDSLQRSCKFWLSDEHDEDVEDANRIVSTLMSRINAIERQLSECHVIMPMRYAEDKEELTDQVIVLNTWMLAQFQVSKAMSEDAQEVLAITIVEEFKSISLDELLLVYKQAIAGKYGEVYNRIDTAVICGWVRKYIADKREAKHAKQVSLHANTATPTRSIVQDAGMARAKEEFMQSKDPQIKAVKRKNKMS